MVMDDKITHNIFNITITLRFAPLTNNKKLITNILKFISVDMVHILSALFNKTVSELSSFIKIELTGT
jgi:hypothetical protein